MRCYFEGYLPLCPQLCHVTFTCAIGRISSISAVMGKESIRNLVGQPTSGTTRRTTRGVLFFARECDVKAAVVCCERAVAAVLKR